MKSVSVQWDIFIAHLLQGKGGGSGEERILSLSFVLPPSEDYRYWRVSGASTQDEPLTHTGSCDARKAQSDGGKNKQLGLDFFFFNYYYFWNHFPPPVDAPLPSCLCCVTANTWFNSVTYGAPRGTSPCLSCQYGFVWLRMFTFERKFSSCLCVSVSVKLI